MKLSKNILITALTLTLALGMSAGEVSPKREMRATWFSTVWAIDWPGTIASGTSAEATQKKQMDAYLKQFEQLRLNTIFFQVRGMSDAFYKSQYEPWSQYLTGERGLAPTYDPLEYLIQEAHKRGMEVHAWINPYRYATGDANYGNLPTDYSKTHPNWIINCGGTFILNPGIPEVRKRVVEVVMDIVDHYDVDGIVFDDYFYQAGIQNSDDDALYAASNPDNLSRGDWRRHQINLMVQDVNNAIKASKPWCRFGIGPAGVAASDKNVAAKYGITPCPSGSDWQYNQIYSEPVQWYVDHSVDYISPQIYWPIGSGEDYALIAPWWASVANKFGRHMYVSSSLSSLVATTDKVVKLPNFNAHETVDEININRASTKEAAPGMVFFSSKRFSVANFISTVANDAFTKPAIVPALTWFRPEKEQGMITNLALSGQNLSWEYTEKGVKYAIYALPKALRHDHSALSTSEYLVGLTYNHEYTLPSTIPAADYAIAVTVIDRYGYEYSPRFYGESMAAKVTPKLLSPKDKEEVLLPTWLEWEANSDAMSYTVCLAYDRNLENIIAITQCDTNAFLTQAFQQIDGSSSYYWALKPNVANAESNWSEVRSFSGKLFSCTYPTEGALDVPVAPVITWDDAKLNMTYTVEIATANDFLPRNMVYAAQTKDCKLQLPDNVLKYLKTYFVRVTAENDYMKVTSLTNMFTTCDVTMTPPVILSPKDGDNVVAPALTITVGDTPNNGFRFEICPSLKFSPRTIKIKETDMGVTSATYEDIDEGQWYARVAVYDSDNAKLYSDTIGFTYTIGTGVSNVHSVQSGRYVVYTISGQFVASGEVWQGICSLPLKQGAYIVKVGDKTTKYVVKE